MSRPVYVGVAWPYANGPLHLGHVAGSLLPPDIFARYHRMAGNDVLMVSGSDCHGTPILLQAEKEGTTPAAIIERFHHDHVEALGRLQIRFDLFTRTTTDDHRRHVQSIFSDALAEGLIEKRTQQAPFDAKAGRFLPDRYVEGTCPHCGRPGARGDQCDHCGKTLDPQDLRDPVSKLNPDTAIEFRPTDHYYFLLSKLQPDLERYVSATAAHWRSNTLKFTQNWLREGLQDRAITRDLTWGVPIPLDGTEDKRIYVWFEAVCGYLTASMEWARRRAEDDWEGILPDAHYDGAPSTDADRWQHWWTDPGARGYYFLGKDNIPFHTIIWPAILIATNRARAKRGQPPLALPYDVPANEFLNLAGEQFSKSRGIGIWVHEILDRFEADAVRYYLSINMPESRDADWMWDDFLAKVNDELVGALGNFVHRVLSFTQKNVGHIPAAATSPISAAVDEAILACRDEVSLHIGAVQLRRGMRRVMDLAQQGNQWMQETAPWALLKSDEAAAHAVLHDLLRIVKALAVTMAPYLPDAAQKTWEMLGEKGEVARAPWSDAAGPLAAGFPLSVPQALFRKLDPKDLPQAAAPTDTEGKGPGGQAGPAGPAPEAPGERPNGTVSFDEFARLEIRTARITSVADHPKADRLYVLTLDAGALGARQVVAGLKAYYRPEELEGRTVAFLANLAPAKLRGVESQGMILAADDGELVSVLSPARDIPPGTKVR